MKNISTLKPKSNVLYTIEDNCPICGVYHPEGDVCKECLKKFDLYTPEIEYVEY